MPRIQTELTPEREAEAHRRVARSRAAVAALPPRVGEPRPHRTASAARAAASRACGHLAEVSATQSGGAWYGVVLLRSDQAWMATRVRECGVRAEVRS